MATEIQYTPVNWVNSPSTYTPISAGNLNKMEKGISDCVTAINDLSAFFTFRGSIATDEDIEDIPNTEKQNGYVYVIQSDSVAIAWSDKENDWVSLGRLEIPDLSDVVSEEDFEELKDKVTVAYIVETGTSGIWTYRKWSDGTVECWGVHTVSKANDNVLGRSVYYPFVIEDAVAIGTIKSGINLQANLDWNLKLDPSSNGMGCWVHSKSGTFANGTTLEIMLEIKGRYSANEN